ncbi:MAG: SPOR domain-containing protein [Bacteroidales bacterium]|jgi:hypothetical protein|nr:SPOR domain-containing protein [Bacteroidales bacterium]
MRIKHLLTMFLPAVMSGAITAQSFVKTADLFLRNDSASNSMGRLEIYQPLQLDTLIGRHILANQNLFKVNNHYVLEGYRIQIYASNNRNAREESNRTRAAFISKFPDTVSYQLYADPGYFKIRVGDFRTKTEAVKLFQQISREFPEAYIVPDIISFPDLNTK